jgi:hypothetical protein
MKGRFDQVFPEGLTSGHAAVDSDCEQCPLGWGPLRLSAGELNSEDDFGDPKVLSASPGGVARTTSRSQWLNDGAVCARGALPAGSAQALMRMSTPAGKLRLERELMV